jgi:hypothetical protein
MRFWKWEVWPWNWRKVRKAQSPLPDENSFHPPDEELQQRAELLAKRATQLLAEITPESAGVSAGVTYKAIASTQDFMQSQSCYAELARRQDLRRADRDTKRETRHFWIELIVIGLLIVGEIGLSLYFGLRALAEGRQQAAILNKVNENTTATAMQIQRAADAMSAFLKIAQQQEADRLAQLAQKPEIVLFVGHVPLAKVHGAVKPSQENEISATFDFVLRNDGEAEAHKVIFRALVPPDGISVISNTPFSPMYSANDLPDRPVRAFLCPLELLRAKNYTQITLIFQFPKGHAPFQAVFNVDAEEIKSNTPLGVLTITPRQSIN